MAVTEIHGALGSFEFELLGAVPREVLDAIEYFGHVAVVPGRMNPLEYGDGTLDAARYVGVVRSKKLADDGRTNLIMDDIRIGGVGMNFWLGDDDDKGAVIETAVELSDVSFNTAISNLLPDSVTVGTIHTVAGTYTGRHLYETPRKAIQYVCDTMTSGGFALYDTFNRGDSANSLGNLDSGQTWVQNSGTWGISSNQAYVSAPGPSAGESYASVSAQADFEAQLTVKVAGGAEYLIFRGSDTINYWRLGAGSSTGTIVLQKIEAGAPTVVGTLTSPMAADTTLKVIASGEAIYCYVNGVLEFLTTDSFNSESTNIGMFTNHTATRFETFSIIPENDPVSFRVNNDATLDAGPESSLYVTEPTCVVVRKGTSFGEDLRMRALPTTIDIDQDMEDFSTRTVMLAENNGDEFATGFADIDTIAPGVNIYKDLHGNALKLTRMVSESDTLEQNANVRAELALRQFIELNRNITLATEDYDIYGSFTVGDYIYIFDPDAGMYDLANEITIRGARLNPVKLQVVESDWPITHEYTVAYRDHDGVWYDLTDYCHFDEIQPSKIVVGDKGRELIGNEVSAAGRIGSSGLPDASVPAAPDFVTSSFQTIAYLDNQGYVHSQQKIVWATPLNVDGTTIADGDRYEIQYRLDVGHLYSQTWGAVSTLRWSDGTPTADEMNTWEQPVEPDAAQWQSVFVTWGTNSFALQELAPGTAYDLRIRAVDSSNNISAWSATEIFTTAVDNIPPSAPNAPTVAGSLIAIQVTHDMGKASGGSFNLESDLAYLEVHAEYEPNYVCTTETKLGNLRANHGLMTAQTPAVGTFQVSQTVPVYVKVVAVDMSGNRSPASAPATVTAELIDDQYISNLSVSKLTAGSITTNWLLAGSIKTGIEGARLEMDSFGLRAYDPDGIETLEISADTGSIEMQGTASSQNYIEGSTGWKIDANGSTQFDNMNILNNVSAKTGNFDEVFMGGILLPSSRDLEEYYKTPSPSLKLLRTTALSTSSDPAVWTVIPWDYIEHILNAGEDMFDSDQPTRLVAPVNGLYTLSLCIQFESQTTQHATIVRVMKNADGTGTDGTKVYEDICPAEDGQRTSNTGSIDLYLNAGDYLEVFIRSYQSEAIGLNTDNSNTGGVRVSLTYRSRFVSGVLDTSLIGSGGGDGSGGDGDANPEPVTKSWSATYTRSFDNDDDLRYAYSKTRCYQGRIDGTQGNQKSLAGFDWQSIQNAIAGKTITRMRLTVRVQHSYYNAGIKAAVGTHKYTSAPSTWDSTNVLTNPRRMYVEDLAPGGTYTFDITQSMINDFESGDATGITFGAAPNDSLKYYGYFYGGTSSSRPKLTITYE